MSSSQPRSSGPGGSPAPTSTAEMSGRSTRSVISRGSWLSGEAVRMRHGVRAATASSRPTARRDAPRTASVSGGRLRASSRGRRWASSAVTSSSSASRASATPRRAARIQPSASMSAPAGAASVPRSRQRTPGRPRRATDVVAAPASIARSALGTVTGSCYRLTDADRRPRSAAATRGEPAVRRPSPSLRRGPRAAR